MQSRVSRRSLLTAGTGLVALPTWAGRSLADQAARTSLDPERDPTDGRRLVFDDGFQMIDPSVWSAGPKAGTAEPGYYGRSAFARIGGEEGFNPYSIVDDSAAENGKALQISAKYIGRPMHVPHYYGNSDREYQWISGNLQTARSDGSVLKSWRHGYFETRMLFPEHPLTWPAFWLLNAGCILAPKTSIEIDVVEHKGFEPHVYGAYLHEWGQPGEQHNSSGVATEPDMTKTYNLYGVLLDGDKCVVYFNRRPIRDLQTGVPLVWTLGRSDDMDAAGDTFWPLITLALRSDYTYPDPLLPEHRLAHMRLDYFKVYA